MISEELVVDSPARKLLRFVTFKGLGLAPKIESKVDWSSAKSRDPWYETTVFEESAMRLLILGLWDLSKVYAESMEDPVILVVLTFFVTCTSVGGSFVLLVFAESSRALA